MRSRPLVRVLLGRSPLEPGEPFDVEVLLTSRSETPTESVDVVLSGEIGVGIPQRKATATRHFQHLPPQRFRWTPGTLGVGEYRQRFRLVLPPETPPSFGPAGGWCRVVYTIEVHVAIPMWIDRRASFSLPVAAPASMPSQGSSAIVATRENGPRAGEMYIEASLEATQIAAGEELRGEVSFANVSTKRIRRVNLALVGSELTREPMTAQNPVMRFATTLVSGPPPEGESFPVRFALPRDLWPSFDASLFAFRWAFEVRADVVLGSDVVLTIPVEVVRPPPGVELPPRSHRAIPVGRQRLTRVWAIVAQRVGLSYDEANGTMLASRGVVSMTLAREAFEGTFGSVAEYRYAHLGLDVRLGERGFFDAMTARRRFSLRNEEANKRFLVTGREHDQLGAFFDDALLGYLLTATRVELDDDALRIHVPGVASSAATLEVVARAALAVLELFDAAIARIPPPSAMIDALPAWRAFAIAMSGRLELGRVWIHDASIGGFRFEVGTVFEPDEAKPHGTLVRVAIEPPLDHALSIDDASLSAIARDALRTLQSEPGFHAEADALGLFIEGPTKDPAALLPKIEAMASVLRSVRGAAATGPFR